ncbi:Sir2 family NAD-dependent protein deacetylase [Abyssalbus ytuae]|uniref:protein acetyllysine N-acetyltransferase n=1 Tax=Abyssalbus ytuae TaxID=2926907 RepID=A0A9E6ZMQ3_9FLAO|nr:Sir2 family NAD-dependent protein deacetylase [Abyssalbus ytuae]UOB17165.1 NAD-dependent deacylase [Abyssalbus ytuae]
MKKLVVLTGAGMSAESGINTFRDSNGLWEGHDVMQVASPMGWAANKGLVLNFYNQRRKQLCTVKPNTAHEAIAKLEKEFDVSVITQNVDDLHERAGSTKVIHLHGELLKARSTADHNLIYDWKGDINIGDVCEKNSQLRPHIVWFYEDVPMIKVAAGVVAEANFLMIVGTSMQVYPAASLINFTQPGTPIYFIDPNPNISTNEVPGLKVISKKATEGVPMAIEHLIRNLS